MPLEDLESKLKESLKTKLYNRYRVNYEDFIVFPQEQIDFIKKLINLRKVDNNIKFITLDTEDKQHMQDINLLRNTDPSVSTEHGQFVDEHHQYVHIEVWLYKQFSGLDKLKGYIKNHELPATRARVGKDLDKAIMIYSLYHEGVEYLFRDSRLLVSKDKPAEKALVYLDDGNLVLE